MATKAKTEEITKDESVKETAAVKEPESVYTAADLIEGHKAFGVSREIVVVALKLAKKESATFAEAKVIIDKFKNREVK